MIQDSVVTHHVHGSHTEALSRLFRAIAHRKMTVFAHIDHAKGAADAGLELRPAHLVIFGAPRAGSLLMQQELTIGLDLPLKILLYRDARGAARLAYHKLSWLAGLYGLDQASVLTPMTQAFEGVIAEVVGASA